MAELDPKLHEALEGVRAQLDDLQKEFPGFRYMLGVFDRGVMGATGNVPPVFAQLFVETYEAGARKQSS